jgi:phage tail-like protein
MPATDGAVSRTTLGGRRGFRTSQVTLRVADETAPAVVSSRRYLRSALPTVYQENGDFGLRFLGGLERVLDPILATLDVLPSYFHPTLAPRDVLELLAAWLGITVDESWPDEQRREVIRRAAELGRRRGTRAGLELWLRISFPDLPLRVEDSGGVTWSADAHATAKIPATGFVVYCDKPLSEAEQAAVARAIDLAKPVHVDYRLRVKTPRKPAGDSGGSPP